MMRGDRRSKAKRTASTQILELSNLAAPQFGYVGNGRTVRTLCFYSAVGVFNYLLDCCCDSIRVDNKYCVTYDAFSLVHELHISLFCGEEDEKASRR